MLLGVPLDIVPPEKLRETIYSMLAAGGGRNIVLLSLWDFLRARGDNDYRDYVQGAALVIPISKALVRGARLLSGKSPVRYMPFTFIVTLLTILEEREQTVYLLGGNTKTLKKTEGRIKETFPHLRVVGRFEGRYKRNKEGALIEVIRKSAPSLLLVNKGVRGRERWIVRHNTHLNAGLRLWCSDIFDVFTARRRRPPAWIFRHGLEGLYYCLRHPWRAFRFVLYCYYNCLLLSAKLKQRKSTSNSPPPEAVR
jgi:N-acetylglucosaminyldiphosphoundecaprenol N-acetyl-beta-D-mannosaminyltransferase